jgi:hypothetical protein
MKTAGSHTTASSDRVKNSPTAIAFNGKKCREMSNARYSNRAGNADENTQLTKQAAAEVL